jgi:spermidine/putrescine transport system ATP-binding protein
MSDRIAVMSHGKVLQMGTPTEIYERPTCKFVADFIGETNFIDGKVVENGGNYATIETPEGLKLRGITPRPVTMGEPATLSIRPEKIRIVPPGDARSENAFIMPVKVEDVSYIGSDTRLTVRLNERRTLDVWEQNTRSTLDRDAYWQPGEAAVLVCPPDNALVLTE